MSLKQPVYALLKVPLQRSIYRVISIVRKTFKPVYFDRSEQLVRSYEAGRCDAISSDRSQLFVLRSILSRPEDHVILDETISKEPLSPVVRDDDILFLN